MTDVPTADLAVEILPARIWVESDMMGARHVMCQHHGLQPFTYATFHYDYDYTSNSGTWDAAQSLARSLGAADPVEALHRDFPSPTADELRLSIALLESELEHLVTPNVRGEAGPTAGHAERRIPRPWSVACRWASPRPSC